MPPGDADDRTVRVAALCGRSVVDEHGVAVGHVIDVRATQDGRLVDGATAAIRITGLVVGRGGLAERLGLLRHRVHGPWLFVVLARVLGHDIRFVAWDQIVEPAALPSTGADVPIRFTGAAERLES